MWEPNPREFILNAFSPAKVGNIEVNLDTKEAKILVTNDQLSLAIGKGGQNVRLAAKLTGFKIDLTATDTISDLDVAMQAAAARGDDSGIGTSSETKRAAFDALFRNEPKAEEALVQETPEEVKEEVTE